LKKYLVIQTASIGDVILSTAIGEKLKQEDANCQVDYLIKKGNEAVFYGNMSINELYIWDKSQEKYKNLLRIIFQIREVHYDAVINLQRFFSSGLFTIFSNAKKKYGFRKNPLSIFFSKSYPHQFKEQWHETERNQQLINNIAPGKAAKPKLYPTKKDFARMSPYKTNSYISITPASLWYTKQYPIEKWLELIDAIDEDIYIYLLGGNNEATLCNEIIEKSKRTNILNMAGKLSIVESAALMKDAHMNYVNDSAAQHIASAVNAPVTAVFCSTIPQFGFGPLSEDSIIVQTQEKLKCRPCGIHGKRTCPENHFKCALTINKQELLNRLDYAK